MALPGVLVSADLAHEALLDQRRDDAFAVDAADGVDALRA